VSNGAARDAGQDRQGLSALEAAVNRTVEELKQLRKRAAEAAERTAELEALLQSFQSGAVSPERMNERLELLEVENRDLRTRIVQGRESVERLLARIQFLEDQK
jgi:predicted RNase H-like nuclease (RuvC/YqgF family)